MNNFFSIWTPIDFSKSSGEEKLTKAPISGIVSSDTMDLQGDTILQEGMDWSYFLRRGWINYEHMQGPEFIVGVPTSIETKITEKGNATQIEGHLLLNRPRGKEVYETAKALQEAEINRSLGFSVEGQVLERSEEDKSVITKARILNVSVTAHPVNTDAVLDIIARSVGYQMPAQPSADAMSPLVEQSLERDMSPLTEQSLERDMSGLENTVREVLKTELAEYMKEQADKVFDKQPATITFKQIKEMVSRTFPSLNYTDCLRLARELFEGAKS